MPIFRLDARLIFPHPSYASPEGVLAVGGDLSEERLLLAYSQGIFPWYSEDEPIIWWSPNPRCLLLPGDLKVSKSMRQFLRNHSYTISMDGAFEQVIEQCKKIPRKGQEGTWITSEMKAAYIALFHAGFAHSVEVWDQDELIGGLYGVSLGKFFAGESMFARRSNVSKLALIHLQGKLSRYAFNFIDCQVYNPHLGSLGAVDVPREEYLNMLEKALEEETLRGNWGEIL